MDKLTIWVTSYSNKDTVLFQMWFKLNIKLLQCNELWSKQNTPQTFSSVFFEDCLDRILMLLTWLAGLITLPLLLHQEYMYSGWVSFVCLAYMCMYETFAVSETCLLAMNNFQKCLPHFRDFPLWIPWCGKQFKSKALSTGRVFCFTPGQSGILWVRWLPPCKFLDGSN